MMTSTCNDVPLAPTPPRRPPWVYEPTPEEAALRGALPKPQSRLAFVLGRLLRGRAPVALAVAVPQHSGGGGTSLRVGLSGLDPAVFGGETGDLTCEHAMRGIGVHFVSAGTKAVLAEDGWTHRFESAGWLAWRIEA